MPGESKKYIPQVGRGPICSQRDACNYLEMLGFRQPFLNDEHSKSSHNEWKAQNYQEPSLKGILSLAQTVFNDGFNPEVVISQGLPNDSFVGNSLIQRLCPSIVSRFELD